MDTKQAARILALLLNRATLNEAEVFAANAALKALSESEPKETGDKLDQ